MASGQFEETYKGVLLKCTPTQLQDGRWSPTLWVTDHRGGGTTETSVTILGGADSYATAQEAADVARSAGRKWADDHA